MVDQGNTGDNIRLLCEHVIFFSPCHHSGVGFATYSLYPLYVAGSYYILTQTIL